MRTCSKTWVFAVLLFALPAGILSRLNTAAKEELQAAVERAMEGRAGAAAVAEVSTGEILAAQELEVAALDQSHDSGLGTNPARTGFNSV
jgi:hypothetical protein